MLYPLFKSIAFRKDPEWVHERTLHLLQKFSRPGKAFPLLGAVDDRPVECMGMRFRNPVGLAAGMDKNGACIEGFSSLGFGFLELGTVTPRPQPGNEKPRLFRLPEHEGIINRMGFNNEGVEALLKRVEASQTDAIVGINIGKNFDTPIERAEEDYIKGLKAVGGLADYVTVNISSPNTSNLRSLQEGDAFRSLLRNLVSTRDSLLEARGKALPLAVKIAPDLDDDQLNFIADELMASGVDAVVATNTTLDRSRVKGHPLAEEAGGLSGAPVREASTEIIRKLSARLQGQLPIIGVGGIDSAAAAREKLEAGATLLQVYSALIYKGPALIKEIVNGLEPTAQSSSAG